MVTLRCVFYAKCNLSPAENKIETFCNMNFRNENLIHITIYLKQNALRKGKNICLWCTDVRCRGNQPGVRWMGSLLCP